MLQLLIGLFCAWEVLVLDVGYVLAYGIRDDGLQVGIAAEELGREAFVHAQHVVNDQDLAVSLACANADDGHFDLLADFLRQFCRNLFQDDGEAA